MAQVIQSCKVILYCINLIYISVLVVKNLPELTFRGQTGKHCPMCFPERGKNKIMNTVYVVLFQFHLYFSTF